MRRSIQRRQRRGPLGGRSARRTLRDWRPHWWGTVLLSISTFPAVWAQAPNAPAAKKAGQPEVVSTVPPQGVDARLDEPTTTEEMWLFLDRELRRGQTDSARRLLERLLTQPNLTPELVLQLREKHGSSLLVMLGSHPELSDGAAKLLDMANKAALAKRGDPERIRHFIEQLEKTPGERDYAIIELRKSGADAFPYLLDAYRGGQGDLQRLYARVLRIMPTECWLPAVALLESGDEGLMGLAVDLLHAYAVPRAADWLWYPSAAPSVAPELRRQALRTLLYLTDRDPRGLPAADAALTAVAERYYDRKGLPDGLGDPIRFWQWTGDGLVPTPMNRDDAEVVLGVNFAQQALALNPGARAAKIVLLSLAARAEGTLDAEPAWRPDGLRETLATAGPDVLTEVFEKAVRDRQTPAVLWAIKALGGVGRDAVLAPDGKTLTLMQRALDYPEPRVQFAAAAAILDYRPDRDFPFSGRVRDTMLRALLGDLEPTALIIDAVPGRGYGLRVALTNAGYRADLASTGRDGFRRLAARSTYTVVLVDPGVTRGLLTQTLTDLTADARTAAVPIVVLDRPDNPHRLDYVTERYPRVRVAPRSTDPAALREVIQWASNGPTAAPLTVDEKKAMRAEALVRVERLARGEPPFVDMRPAVEPLGSLLLDPSITATVAASLAQIPSSDAQRNLAEATLSGTAPIEVRRAAANGLARHVQRFGDVLTTEQLDLLLAMRERTDDQEFRMALARLTGLLDKRKAAVASRLLRYQPVAGGRQGNQNQESAPARPSAPAQPNEPTEPAMEPEPTEAEPARKAPKARKNFFEE